MGLPEIAYVSEAEYLAEEKKSTEKHEYYQGQVFAMSGASILHNKISRNLLVALANKLKGKGCEPFGSDLRIHIPANTLYTYPDLSIFCGEIEKADKDFDTAINPVAIIEILSKSTKDYDRGTKFELYRSIKSLKNYIVFDSTKVQAESYTKNEDDSWTLRDYKNMEESVFIHSVETSLILAEVYEGVF